jgi:hypothetical protein
LSTTKLLSWLANIGTIFSLVDRSIPFMTRLEKPIELVESSQLVTQKNANKRVLVVGEKKRTNKVTKNTNKGDLVKDEKIETWEKARRPKTL